MQNPIRQSAELKSPITDFIKRNKLFFLKAVAFLGITLFASHLAFTANRQFAIEALQKAAESEFKQFSSQVLAPKEKFSYLPKFVALNKRIEEVLEHPKNARRVQDANELLEKLNEIAGSSAIYLMDHTGNTIAASNWQNKQSFVGHNYGFRPYFTEAWEKGTGKFNAMGVTSGVPGYYIAQRIQKGTTKLGVVAVKVDLRDLNFGWDQNRHELMVTDESGVIFLSSREEWKYRPIAPLTASVKEKLDRTRRYEGVLKEAFPIEQEETLSPGQKILKITSRERWYWNEQASYLANSRTLPNSEWTVNILTPLDTIEANAWRAALTTMGALALLIVLYMYLIQLRIRAQERNESRLALEKAHHTLEQNHRVLQELNEELRIQSITDPLTGIANRRFFMETVQTMTHAARRYRYPLSIIMIDVDHFKQINDVHGHPAGDKVLQTIAALYKEEMRETDILARFGGEEFIIALPHTDCQAAFVVAERIRGRIMHELVEAEGAKLNITVSCGISQYPMDENDIKDTIKRADDALYKAKNSGRNKVTIAA